MGEKNKITNNPSDIIEWVEARSGRPALIKWTKDDLKIDFDNDDEKFVEISWNEFFRILEDKNLVMMIQSETSDGLPSRYYRFLDKLTMSEKLSEENEEIADAIFGFEEE